VIGQPGRYRDEWASQCRQRSAVDCVGDRAPQARIFEQRSVRVERKVVNLELRVDEVLLATMFRGLAAGPVARGELGGESAQVACARTYDRGVVGSTRLHVGDRSLV
jgi:hypothetical protein